MKKLILFCVAAIALTTSCKKFLDAKPDKKLVVPETLQDFQSLLDNNAKMNSAMPWSGEGSADNYYLTNADYNTIPENGRKVFLWQDEIVGAEFPNDWSSSYEPVGFCNVVLEGLQQLDPTKYDEQNISRVKGEALLFRAQNFLHAAWIWSKGYDSSTALSDLGIPLRLNSNSVESSTRSNVQQTYERIITDLKEAAGLLPITSAHAMRPSRPAAFAYLARTLLSMRRYEEALKYADSCLQLRSTLMDYNLLNAAAAAPIPIFNTEVVMHMNIRGSAGYWIINKVDSTLYNSYSLNDLRRTIFFRSNTDGSKAFKGHYGQTGLTFNGVAVDEILLIRAECLARIGNFIDAMNDLNTLLSKRWKSGSFTAFTATTKAEALDKILAERRKELIFRDLRFIDIKRLNKEGANIILKRLINNQEYILPPNDNRYALPLPLNIITTSGMPQNPR